MFLDADRRPFTSLQLSFFEGASSMNINKELPDPLHSPPYSWNSHTRTFHKAYESPLVGVLTCPWLTENSLLIHCNSTERLVLFLAWPAPLYHFQLFQSPWRLDVWRTRIHMPSTTPLEARSKNGLSLKHSVSSTGFRYIISGGGQLHSSWEINRFWLGWSIHIQSDLACLAWLLDSVTAALQLITSLEALYLTGPADFVVRGTLKDLWRRPRVRVGQWYKSRHSTVNLA